MRGILVVALGMCCACFACSTSSPSAAAVDASGGPQSAGYPCDPSAAEPCLPTGDPCVGIACDPVQKICTQFDVDGGPLCSATNAPCATTADCATGLTCGFPVPAPGATDACGATGRCIDPPLACENDAASCGAQAPACGCDGAPDPFVVPGFAASPVATLTPCPDGGPVVEAGLRDAGAAVDASDGASP